MIRLLLIEDDSDTAESLILLLEQDGFRVRWAPTGGEAIRELIASADDPPDVVLLDLMLPDMPGTEVVRAARGKVSLPPLVLHSAVPESSLGSAAREMAAVGILRKPSDIRDIREVLASAAGENRVMTQAVRLA